MTQPEMEEITQVLEDYQAAMIELTEIAKERILQISTERVLYSKDPLDRTVRLYFSTLDEARKALHNCKLHLNDYGVINLNKIIFESFNIESQDTTHTYFDTLSNAFIAKELNSYILILRNYKEDNDNEINGDN